MKKKIYIVLSFSGSLPSRLIRLWTKDEYCHVSLALDEELNDLYSFGRKGSYNIFNGGFVKEGLDRGVFKRFKKTKTAIYSLEVSRLQYRRVVKEIEKFKQDKDKYRYDMIGVLSVALKKPFRRENYFYCSDFVKYIIEKARIDLDLPEVVKPMDFKQEKLDLVYKGLLRDYKKS